MERKVVCIVEACGDDIEEWQVEDIFGASERLPRELVEKPWLHRGLLRSTILRGEHATNIGGTHRPNPVRDPVWSLPHFIGSSAVHVGCLLLLEGADAARSDEPL